MRNSLCLLNFFFISITDIIGILLDSCEMNCVHKWAKIDVMKYIPKILNVVDFCTVSMQMKNTRKWINNTIPSLQLVPLYPGRQPRQCPVLMLHLFSWQFVGHVKEHFSPKYPGSLHPKGVNYAFNAYI